MAEDQPERRLPGSKGLSPLERDVMDQSRQLTEMFKAIHGMQLVLQELVTKEAIRSVEDKHIDERFDRVETRLDGITSLGRWILGAFGSTFVAAIAAFVAGGGLNLVK